MTESTHSKPLLFLDVDGVISVFGFSLADEERLPGPFHWVDGIAHCIPLHVGPRIVRLSEFYDLVWATGWEEKANEYLPHLLELPFGNLPTLTFDGRATFGSAHWKLDAINDYAAARPAAWVDDNLDEECEAWAAGRAAPTLLLRTESPVGLTDVHVGRLLRWAEKLAPPGPGQPVS